MVYRKKEMWIGFSGVLVGARGILRSGGVYLV
jgi:hypothetical protein